MHDKFIKYSIHYSYNIHIYNVMCMACLLRNIHSIISSSRFLCIYSLDESVGVVIGSLLRLFFLSIHFILFDFYSRMYDSLQNYSYDYMIDNLLIINQINLFYFHVHIINDLNHLSLISLMNLNLNLNVLMLILNLDAY